MIAPVTGQYAVIKGRVIDSNSGEPVAASVVRIQSHPFEAITDGQGLFEISGNDLPQGEQVLTVSFSGYVSQRIAITVQNGKTINLDPILLRQDLTEVEAQIGIISLSDNELHMDEGTAFSVSGLLHASNDVFLNAAAYDFSATFFRPRGLDNANGKVLINGIEMNKMFNGRPQWSNWGGLNDAQRNCEFSMGHKANDYTFGDLAGTTNIVMRASGYRKGGRVSYAMSNRSYEGRIMGSFNSGLTKDGWAYSILVSRRFGNEGYVDGTLYDANSFFFSVEKKFGKGHSLNLSAFYTPNRRGRSTAITQEVRDLKGIRYNPNWGYLNDAVRNSRVREIKEPVIMLNHFMDIGGRTRLNTNLAYQFGRTGNTRIDNGGTRVVQTNDGQETFIGGARNPLPNYYQLLPSFFLQNQNPSPTDFRNAFLAERDFINDGQLDWEALYRANAVSTQNGGNSVYVIQNDRTDDTQFTANMILNSQLTENIALNISSEYRMLRSENFAELSDLLGGTGYLDVDYFAEDDVNTVVGDLAQSDLQNRNRIVTEGDRYKYNYLLKANALGGFVQAQFKYNKVDFFLAVNTRQTGYQRTGLFENGNFPGNRSLGDSRKLNFTTYGVKCGLTYKISGRHVFDANATYFTKAPSLRNTFSNARQNNDVVMGLEEERILGLDGNYIYRSPMVKARVTGFYASMEDQTDIGFYFTENLSGLGVEQSAFVQEIMTNIETLRTGVEMGIEFQATPTFKVKAAASYGQYTFKNNPKLYLTSDDFEGVLTFGDGTARLKDYHLAGGPERAYQLGFEYRDPDFWWIGTTTNYFSNAYIDVNNLARTANFSSDFDGQPFNDFDPDVSRELLRQERFDDYFLVNVIGGKSWRIKRYFVGFFATINNLLDQEYVTGGFEQGRLTNFRDIHEDKSRAYGPVFGPRYFFGSGTTYYVNVYVRF